MPHFKLICTFKQNGFATKNDIWCSEVQKVAMTATSSIRLNWRNNLIVSVTNLFALHKELEYKSRTDLVSVC